MRKNELIKRVIKIAEKKYPEGYNKQQLIACSKEVFNGRKGIPTDYRKIDNDADIINQRNAMIYIDGHYPASITDCEVVGINGDCGEECPVFLRGDCQEEIKQLTKQKNEDTQHRRY